MPLDNNGPQAPLLPGEEVCQKGYLGMATLCNWFSAGLNLNTQHLDKNGVINRQHFANPKLEKQR